MPPPPNLAISSQMTMKLGKDILWVGGIFTIEKHFDHVVVMLILWRHKNATAEKVEGFRGFLLDISRTVRLIFKLISFLSIYVRKFSKLKRLKIGHSLLLW